MVVKSGAGRRVSILGVTGTVGQHTKDIILQSANQFDVQLVSANRNVDGLIESAIALNAKCAVITEERFLPQLIEGLAGTHTQARAGQTALIEEVAKPVDWVMCAIIGSVALEPTMAAIKTGADIAMANKECLVCAGPLMKEAAKLSGATLIPVDSEHNAIFQILHPEHQSLLNKMTLTASGGPFRQYTSEQLRQVTIQQALVHPNWAMGEKITIDSASLMNKGLELIEAYYLFGVKAEQLDVVVHPQSIIHALLHYQDGSVLAQMSHPTMEVPIRYALSWPKRMAANVPLLDLTKIKQLTFEPVDHVTFPAVKTAFEVLRAGGSKPIIFNTVNEWAVSYFLKGQIKFLDIVDSVCHMLNILDYPAPCSIEEIMGYIEEIGVKTESYLKKQSF